MMNRRTFLQGLGAAIGAEEIAIYEAARQRWPEMVAEPIIVSVTCGTVEVPIYEGGGWFGKEVISLEQVGPYVLGYGPRTGYLAVKESDA
jgi:hypothetical protein